VVAQPVQIEVTEGTEVILTSGVNPGDQVVVDGQEKLLPGSRVSIGSPDGSTGGGGRSRSGGGAAGNSGGNAGGQAASGAPASAGDPSAAFGPGAPGPSEPSSNPRKHGIETGSGVADGGQPHKHRGQGQTPSQTGQQP
jgi:hypothetical protein